ncbi:hypothetical protein SAMD00023353_1901790 [Rosellinia necatrix]|uniref:Uncharacterized protein n=1 Tax=Rosellinia necatrix TaxID=77044 RepID=A0A1W2TEG9_ROSNE|nr:hypothetical protein SAMD00023353_1901790 [Rosellinia necatrix]
MSGTGVPENRWSLVNMYLQPNENSTDCDCYRLPTLAMTRDESLSVLARVPANAQVHFTVVVPQEPTRSPYSDQSTRLRFNMAQIEAARREYATFIMNLEHLNRMVAQDPSKRPIRDQFYAFHSTRINVLSYMVRVGNGFFCNPVPGMQLLGPNTHSNRDAPPPYRP